MNKCLVTKLNSNVNNDELLKIGEIRFAFDKDTKAKSNLTIKGDNVEGQIIILKNAKLYDYNKTNLLADGSSFSLPYQGDFSVEGTGIEPCEVRYFDKYNLNNITTEYLDLQKNWVGFINSLNLTKQPINSNDLESFNKDLNNATFSYYKGKLKDFARFTKLRTISVSNFNSFNGVVGTLSDLGTLTELITVSIGGQKYITGSLEDFVKANRTSGRTSCDKFTLYCSANQFTFNGNPLNATDIILKWTATTITVNDTTITA